MSDWTHKGEGPFDHEPDPTYNGNGLPAFWTCHVKGCERELLLDGGKVPITQPPARKAPPPKAEPPMSSQP